MNGEKQLATKPKGELVRNGNTEPQVSKNFIVDGMTMSPAFEISDFDAVYKKSFDTIDELRGVLESIGFQMAELPMRLPGSGQRHAQIEVFKNGIKVVTLGIRAKASLEGTPISPQLSSGEDN